MSAATNDLTNTSFWDVKHGHVKQLANHGWLRRLARRKVDRLLAEFLELSGSQPADVLELGCAPGRVIERMHSIQPQHRYHGIDFAAEGTAATKQILGELQIAAQIHHGDIRSFDLPYQCDLVVSFGLLEHFLDPVPIVRDHMRFCKPGGYVAVTVPNLATPVNNALMRWFDPQGVPAHQLEIMHPTVMHDVLVAAGLEGVRSGGEGGPCVKPKARCSPLFNQVYRGVTATWNGLAAVVPGNFPWAYQIWGIGRVPG
jgi:SAM-dependent methyltransferase